MITETTMLYLYVETPLHAGVGSGLSSIDLPIQRERTTQYPMIQGSGIKGKLRATAEDVIRDKAVVDVLFGPATTSGDDYAGALIAGDARILLFPVRSLNGVFAYTTSYDVLSRFKRDVERGQARQTLPWHVPKRVTGKALVTTTSEVQTSGTIVLEEFSFEAQLDAQVDAIADWIMRHALPDMDAEDYWPNKVKNSLVILPNDDFRDFALYATEVITRVRLDRQKKTVEPGALWTEEHLPTDTLLYVPIYATDTRQNGKSGPKMTAEQVLKLARSLDSGKGSYLQLGGDETVGRGLVRMRWASLSAGAESR
jgi:CRISPR-associated protein Cmr4